MVQCPTLPAPSPLRSPRFGLLSLGLGLGLAFALTACSSALLATESADAMACPAESVEILESNQPMEGPSSWRARCGEEGQLWFCSRMHQKVICTEDPRPVPEGADAPT